jgi:hypothetical protein
MLIVLLSLAACTSPEEQEIADCTELGFRVNTPEFAECRLKVRSIAQQEQANRIAAFGLTQQIRANQPKTCVPSGNGVTCY